MPGTSTTGGDANGASGCGRRTPEEPAARRSHGRRRFQYLEAAGAVRLLGFVVAELTWQCSHRLKPVIHPFWNQHDKLLAFAEEHNLSPAAVTALAVQLSGRVPWRRIFTVLCKNTSPCDDNWGGGECFDLRRFYLNHHEFHKANTQKRVGRRPHLADWPAPTSVVGPIDQPATPRCVTDCRRRPNEQSFPVRASPTNRSF